MMAAVEAVVDSVLVAVSRSDATKDTKLVVDAVTTVEAKEPIDEPVEDLPPPDLDVGRCMVVEGLPSSLFDDSFDVFGETIMQMMIDDFNVDRNSVECVLKLSKQADAEDEENASRALVSFKSRVHKHRIFAVKARLEIPSCMNLVQIKSIPEEVLGMSTSAVYEVEEKCEENMEPEKLEEVQIVELERTPIIERAKTPLVEQEETHMVEQEEDHESVDLEEGEMLLEEELSVQDDGTEGGGVAEIKSEDVKKEEEQPSDSKKKYFSHDEHKNLPFKTSWEGAPQFWWKMVKMPVDSRRLVINNADVLDIYEPFLYRTYIRADRVLMKMPKRQGKDGDLNNIHGSITLEFEEEHEVIGEVFRNLIYSRMSENRKHIIIIPKSEKCLHKKKELDSQLARKIVPTPAMHQLLLKAHGKSIAETATYSLEEAKAAFPRQLVTKVERVHDKKK